MKTYINIALLISVFGLVSCVFEEDDPPKPSSVFVKYFGQSGIQEIRDMIVNTNNNVVILGDQIVSETGANRNVMVIVADTMGNEIRSITLDIARDFAAANETAEFGGSIKEIDAGYLVAGSYAELIDGQTQQFKAFWALINKDFEVGTPIIKIDTLRAGADTLGNAANHLFAEDIIQSSDGNVILVGRTDLKAANDETPAPGDQFFIAKRDFNQDTTIWRRTYGYTNSDESAIAVYELADQSIAMIGSSTNHVGEGGATGNNIEIFIFNNLASSLVTAGTYGVSIGGDISASDQPNDVIKVDGGFVIVGTSTLGTVQRPFLMGILENADIIFNRSMESVHGIDAQGKSVARTRENDLVVIGAYPRFQVTTESVPVDARDKNSEVMFLRTGQTGIVRSGFEGNFGLVSGNDVGQVARSLPNGSIMIGATIDFGSNQTMIALMKLNDQGVLQRQ